VWGNGGGDEHPNKQNEVLPCLEVGTTSRKFTYCTTVVRRGVGSWLSAASEHFKISEGSMVFEIRAVIERWRAFSDSAQKAAEYGDALSLPLKR